MKFLKSHDGIALTVLVVVILFTVLTRNIFVKTEKVEKTHVSCMEYTDIDSQCMPMRQ